MQQRGTFFSRAFGFAQGSEYDITRAELLQIAQFNPVGNVFATTNPDAAVAGEQCVFTTKCDATRIDAGVFAVASVAQLRAVVVELMNNLTSEQRNLVAGVPHVQSIVGDSRQLHSDSNFNGAVFQVASQLNCLEFATPQQVPESGIECYEDDHTQGPACAIACAAGTAYRNYLLKPLPRQRLRGQTMHAQLNTLAGVEDVVMAAGGALFSVNPPWTVKNGYVDATTRQLTAVKELFDGKDGVALRSAVVAAVRVGFQLDTTVTDRLSSPQLVTQVFCSALSVAYASSRDTQLWEPLATAVLCGVYEASMLICAAQWLRQVLRLRAPDIASSFPRSPPLILTRVGGGVFGNLSNWIDTAMEHAVRCASQLNLALDVRLSYFKAPDALARQREAMLNDIAAGRLANVPQRLTSDASPAPSERADAMRRPREAPLPKQPKESAKIAVVRCSLEHVAADAVVHVMRRTRQPDDWVSATDMQCCGADFLPVVQAAATAASGDSTPPVFVTAAGNMQSTWGLVVTVLVNDIEHFHTLIADIVRAVPAARTIALPLIIDRGEARSAAQGLVSAITQALTMTLTGTSIETAIVVVKSEEEREAVWLELLPSAGDAGAYRAVDVVPKNVCRNRQHQEVRLMTCNMLFDGYYQRHAKCPIMPVDQRDDIMFRFFDKALQNVDVACLQEFDLDFLGSFRQRYGATFGIVLARTDAHETCAILYRRETVTAVGRSTLVSFPSSRSPSTKCGVMQLLETAHSKRRVAMISIHAPFSSDVAEREQILYDICAEASAHPTRAYAIVGDFNASPEGFGARAMEAAFPSARWVDALSNAQFSVERGNRIDYAMVTRANGVDFDPASLVVEPPLRTQLLPHDAGLAIPSDPFFSDHAALFVTLIL